MKHPPLPHSPRAWWLAARPKTLAAAWASVTTAAVMAYTSPHELHPHAPWLVVCCLLFAGLMQVASNFINDRIDYLRGTDTHERLGPERACQQGWITPQAMQRAIVGVVGVALLTGLAAAAIYLTHTPYPPATLLGGLAALGASCVAAAFLYTTVLSRWGLGDVLVVLFFGLVPVGGTFFLLTHTLTLPSLLLGLGVGLVVDTLLVVNNFRDRDTDRAAGRRTLVVLMGDRWGARLYYWMGWLGTAAFILATLWHIQGPENWGLLMCFYLMVHHINYRRMLHINHGRALNAVLGSTAAAIMLWAVLAIAVMGMSKS